MTVSILGQVGKGTTLLASAQHYSLSVFMPSLSEYLCGAGDFCVAGHYLTVGCALPKKGMLCPTLGPGHYTAAAL